MIYKFFGKKIRLGAKASVNEELVQELHKPIIKKFKKEESMCNLKIIFGQQIQQKWDHHLVKIEMLNIHYVCQMFSQNMEVKKAETFMVLLKQ